MGQRASRWAPCALLAFVACSGGEGTLRTLAGSGPGWDAGPELAGADGGEACDCVERDEICEIEWDGGASGDPVASALVISGAGPAQSTVLALPIGLALAPDGQTLYVATLNALERVDVSAATITPLAASDPSQGTCGLFAGGENGGQPMGLALGSAGLVVDFAAGFDLPGQTLGQWALDGGFTPLTSQSASGLQDGAAPNAEFDAVKFPGYPPAQGLPFPYLGLWVDDDGVVWVADVGNGRIRRIADGWVVSVAGGGIGGDGPGPLATLAAPTGIVGDGNGNFWIADGTAVRKMDAQFNVTTFAGQSGQGGHVDGSSSGARFQNLMSITRAQDGNLYVVDGTYLGGDAAFGTASYLDDYALYIRRVDGSGNVTTVAGDGEASLAYRDGPALHSPVDGFQIAVDPQDEHVYFAAPFANQVRVLDLP